MRRILLVLTAAMVMALMMAAMALPAFAGISRCQVRVLGGSLPFFL
jgi:hypothetical protein